LVSYLSGWDNTLSKYMGRYSIKQYKLYNDIENLQLILLSIDGQDRMSGSIKH